jgi:fructose transport system substrate-binding protein
MGADASGGAFKHSPLAHFSKVNPFEKQTQWEDYDVTNLKKVLILGAAALGMMSAPVMAADLACLITKNNTNPFFVKMKEGAEAAAKTAGLDFKAYAGVTDGDAAPQITAIENCVAAGAKGILITPSNDSVGPALKDARAAGILVIALDTPLADKEAQDMTFATDNFQAGLLIGQWAAAKLGPDGVKTAKIAMLDINKDNISVDVQRDTGFLKGFGIEVPDLAVLSSEKDARVIGHETSNANPEGGQSGMENLLAKDPDINVVYTINEPAAEGAFQALKSAGKEKGVLIVSVDGGCPGVANVKAGVIGATSQQYPLLMAAKGIEAIVTYAKDGTKPAASEGLSFFNTGVNLVTDQPADGVPSIDTAKGTELCWG